MCITQVESASFPLTENKQKINKNNLHTYADALHIHSIFNVLRVCCIEAGQ